MNAPALRVRSVGEILDLACQLYRGRWRQMAAAAGMLILPLLVLLAVAPAWALPLLDWLSELFHIAASAAVVVIASEAYLGRQVSAAHAMRAVGRRVGSVWGAAIIQTILLGLGLLLLVVPVLVATAWTFAMQQAVMIEGRGAGEAFVRSRQLATGQWKHILLTSAVMFLIVILGMGTFLLVLLRGVTDERLTFLLVNIGMSVTNPLAAAVGTVLYYDLRIRREAFDVAVATERLADMHTKPVPAY